MSRATDRLARWRRAARRVRGHDAIVHCAHHKVGTLWWGTILRAIARDAALRFVEWSPARPDAKGDVYLFPNTRFFDRGHLGGRPFRGTHMIRDPRDVVVSSYFYHLWTEEPWANLPATSSAAVPTAPTSTPSTWRRA